MISKSFEIIDRKYGKSWVKLLHVQREGLFHTIREYEVDTKLTLTSEKDYLEGDNSDVIATDSQKNTVYLLANKFGIESPEKFAVLLCNHFLKKYPWIQKARIHVKVHPWRRIKINEQEHSHAFISDPVCQRVTTVSLQKGGDLQIISGLKGLRVLKTTQSGFEGFVQDEFQSLPYVKDRIFSTIVEVTWKYQADLAFRQCFDQAFEQVKTKILDYFAGEPKRGLYSPSVQQTMYLIQKSILQARPSIEWVQMAMPNKHYFTVDLSKYPKSVGGTNHNTDVFMPVDKPSGMIEATLARKDLNSKL